MENRSQNVAIAQGFNDLAVFQTTMMKLGGVKAVVQTFVFFSYIQ